MTQRETREKEMSKNIALHATSQNSDAIADCLATITHSSAECFVSALPFPFRTVSNAVLIVGGSPKS
jgi:hypothetical protein